MTGEKLDGMPDVVSGSGGGAPPAPQASAPPPTPVPEPEPTGDLPAGFEAPSTVMDQDDLDAVVTVNVETVFREIFLVKVMGTLFMVLAGVLAFLPALLEGNDFIVLLPSMVLGVVGMVFGILGFFVRSLRKWMLYLAPGALIAAVATRPLTSAIGSLDFMELILGLAFAICWFLGLEYLHALSRFVEVGEMAIKRRLSNFNLSGVVKHFLMYGFLMLAIVVLITLGVIGIVPLMKGVEMTFLALGGLMIAIGVIGSLFMVINQEMMGAAVFGGLVAGCGAVLAVVGLFTEGSDLFANSAELNSVFGIAIGAAVVFTIMGLVLTVYYQFTEGISTVEKVEYSREKLQEMLDSGQVLSLEEGTSPAGGESP